MTATARRILVGTVCGLAGILFLEGMIGLHPKVELIALEDSAGPVARIDARGDRLQAVVAHEGKVYAIEDHYLYVSEDTGRTYRRLGMLPDVSEPTLLNKLRERIARSAITRKIRRNPGPRAAVVLSSGTILVFYDHIYRSVDGGRTFSVVPNTDGESLPGGFPSSVGYAVGQGDTVYFGEYTTAARPHEVRVARGTDDGQTWTVAHTFPSGDIFHIHSITYDGFRNRFWIAAGDRVGEEKLMYTDDHFHTIQTAGCCTQAWRLVDLIVTEDALYWGSDDDEVDPGIYRFDIAGGVLDRVATLDNPSYHAASIAGGWMAISTTFEPNSPFTRDHSPAQTTSLWVSRDGVDWTNVFSLDADPEVLTDLRRPQIQIPAGDPLPALIVTPWHTRSEDFVTLRFNLVD